MRKDIMINNNKKEIIIDTAANLFSEFGFHEINMDMIAKKAGIAKGTIYNYFKSKEELYFTINETRLNKLITELERKFNEQILVIDDLRGFVIHVFMFLLKYKDFFLIFQRTRLRKQQFASKSLEEKINRLKEMIANILNEGIKENMFKKLDVCFTADMILGTIYSAVLRNLEKDIHHEKILHEREALFEFIKNAVLISEPKILTLKGKTILITRSIDKSDDVVQYLTSLGADVIVFPTIKLVQPSSFEECDKAIQNLETFDYVIFTSQNAVDWFLKRVDILGKLDILKSKKIISIGKKTSEKLNEHKISVYFMPKISNSENFIDEFRNIIHRDEKVLLPQSRIAREYIQKSLEMLGAVVTRIDVYDVNLPSADDVREQIKIVNEKKIDVVIFTSPSTFDNFIKLMNIHDPNEYFGDKVIAVIGPTTRRHIESKGISVMIEAKDTTFESIIKSIVEYYICKL